MYRGYLTLIFTIMSKKKLKGVVIDGQILSIETLRLAFVSQEAIERQSWNSPIFVPDDPKQAPQYLLFNPQDYATKKRQIED